MLVYKNGKGGVTMGLCAGLVCVMTIAIWLDDASFWKWLKKKLKRMEGVDWLKEIF
jgi:hypothetical protein